MTDTTETDTTTPHPATAFIEQALTTDGFASRVHVWEDTLRYPQRGETWFTREHANGDPEIAATKLAEHLAEREVIAGGVKAVAEGMCTIARVNPKDSRRTDQVYMTDQANEQSVFPHPFGASSNARTVVVINPEVPGCGCMQPAQAHLFGVHGLLGLKAITLTVDPGNSSQNQLCLVLPHRNASRGPAAVAIAQFDLQGHVRTHTLEPLLDNWGPLMYSLGLQDKSNAWQMWQSSGGDPDSTLGPGCTALLCSSLTNLGSYLTDAADKLSGNHSHSH
ncbi:MAG TPA: hypothetical protein VK694_07700 [Verrucomicrobiae bacterium]|nr:hypothetical protein [Verrucomicrobiae bacterium]